MLTSIHFFLRLSLVLYVPKHVTRPLTAIQASKGCIGPFGQRPGCIETSGGKDTRSA